MFLLRICDFMFTEMFHNLSAYLLLLSNVKKSMHNLSHGPTNHNQASKEVFLSFCFLYEQLKCVTTEFNSLQQ